VLPVSERSERVKRAQEEARIKVAQMPLLLRLTIGGFVYLFIEAKLERQYKHEA
jgi:hypothetical protein